ncbi:MAG: hypothetical protein EZS28_002952, partial [Streblomastix strix]
MEKESVKSSSTENLKQKQGIIAWITSEIPGEASKQIGQLVLKLRQAGLDESETVAALQQIITYSVNSQEGPGVVRENGAVEVVSTLLAQSQSIRVKQLCGAVVGVVLQLSALSGNDIDWTSVCAPLAAMLFSTDEGLSTTGKNSLTILAERSKNAISGVIQVGLINRAAEALNDNSSSSSSSSCSSNNESTDFDFRLISFDIPSFFSFSSETRSFDEFEIFSAAV